MTGRLIKPIQTTRDYYSLPRKRPAPPAYAPMAVVPSIETPALEPGAVDDASVVAFVMAGCNAAEIAAYAGVDSSTAIALMVRARQQIARAP
jgi:hypothetical protein